MHLSYYQLVYSSFVLLCVINLLLELLDEVELLRSMQQLPNQQLIYLIHHYLNNLVNYLILIL